MHSSAEVVGRELTESLLGERDRSRGELLPLWSALGFEEPQRAEDLILAIGEDPFDRGPLMQFLPHLFLAAAAFGAPDRLVGNFSRFVNAHGSPRYVISILMTSEPVRDLSFRLWSHSDALSDVLVRNPEYLEWLLTDAALDITRSRREFDAEFFSAWETGGADDVRALEAIRRTHRRELLRIGVRDLLDLAPLREILHEISWLAETVVERVLRVHTRAMLREFGVPRAEDEPDGPQVGFCVMGMGKLGGEELNYSSDIDLMFVYAREGWVWREDAGRSVRGITNHEFFTRLGKRLVQSLTEWGREGFLYRVDLRLRPEGDTGPLVRSLESYENYYASHGETWERMALIKMRPIAGDRSVGRALIEAVQPFVFPRHLGADVLEEIAAIKGRIEREVVRRGPLQSNLKLGPGGIRDIEFIAQSFQILQAGQHPRLQRRGTIEVLREMGSMGVLQEGEVRDLIEGYAFLRRLEHRIQMDHQLQTHVLPSDAKTRHRIAKSLGMEDAPRLMVEVSDRMRRNRALYESSLVQERVVGSRARTERERNVQYLIDRLNAGDEPGVVGCLHTLGWPDHGGRSEVLIPHLRALALGSDFTHSGARTLRLARLFLDHLFKHLGAMGRPLQVFVQMDRFIRAYGARSLLLESLTSNPRAMDLLWHLFDGSRVLGEEIIRDPALFDEVVSGTALDAEIDTERVIGLVLDHPDAEAGWESLRRIKRGERFRIGIRYLESLDVEEEMLQQFSALADLVVEAGLRLAERWMSGEREGEGALQIVAMGKWGGGEIGFGGDLDLIYVGAGAESTAEQRIAVQFGRGMEGHSPMGRLFELDPRLRPDGGDGPLVTNEEALIRYFERRAQNWERLAWTRARRVVGTSPWHGFEELRHRLIRSGGWSAEWIGEIGEMRMRIERERLRGEVDASREFKSGPGGLLDLEFLGQLATVRRACLGHQGTGAERLPSATLEMLDLAEADGWFADSAEAEFARRHYRHLRRCEQLLRIGDERSNSSLPADAEELLSLAMHLGFEKPDTFLRHHGEARVRCREIFDRAMSAAAERAAGEAVAPQGD